MRPLVLSDPRRQMAAAAAGEKKDEKAVEVTVTGIVRGCGERLEALAGGYLWTLILGDHHDAEWRVFNIPYVFPPVATRDGALARIQGRC